MTEHATISALLAATAGEPVVFGACFSPPRFQSTFLALLRVGQRATGTGGIGGQFAINNFIAVTEDRVLLWRGPVKPEQLVAEWPRGSVTGTAVRKHWVSSGQTDSDKFVLRTTMATPDGEVVVDLDEKKGGRKMLQTLGIAFPPPKPARRWRPGSS